MAKNKNKKIFNNRDELMNHFRRKFLFLLQYIQTDGQENNDKKFYVEVGKDADQKKTLFD